MPEENKNSIVAENPLIGIVIALCVVILTIVFYFKCWLKKISPTEGQLGSLRSNAHRLRLKLHHVEGDSMYEAIADQLMFSNPRGTHTSDMIKQRIKRNALNNSNTFYVNVGMLKRNRRWTMHVAVLHEIADAYNRTIEVIHGDRTETTVVRPSGIDVKHPVQTLYIGYVGQDLFFSLRPEIEDRPAENGTRESNVIPKRVIDHGGSNTNVLIGDNSQQYVIHLPSEDDTNETRVTKNIVVGDGTSQNILATFRTPKELVDFLKDMQSSGTEGSEHSLRLKIRQKSNTLTDEQIKEKEERIIALLEDDNSETRRELDEALKDFSVSFEKATLECILLYLSPVSVKALHTFVKRFQDGDLESVIKFLVMKQCKSTKKLTLNIDVQLQLYMKLSLNEREQMFNSEKYISGRKLETVLATKETNRGSNGISLILRRKADSSPITELSAKDVSEKISRSSLECLGKTGLFKGATEIEARLETFSSRRLGMDTNKSSRLDVLQHATSIMSETVRGCIGVVHSDHGVQGTCFRVGSRYIMTACHVVQATVTERHVDMQRLTENDIAVEFPDVQEKHSTKVVYFSLDLDIAVLRLADGQSECRSLLRIGECYPGFPFYTVGYPGFTRKTKRSVIVSTDYLTKTSSSELVLFESDLFDHGCSGAPGLAIIDGEASLVTMLLGCIFTESNVWYYGVNMAEVYRQIQVKDPDLAAQLFGQIYKPGNKSFQFDTGESQSKAYALKKIGFCSKFQRILKEFEVFSNKRNIY